MRTNIIVRLRKKGRREDISFDIAVFYKGKKPSSCYVEKIGFHNPIYFGRVSFVDLNRLSFWLARGIIIEGKSSIIIAMLCFYFNIFCKQKY